jgi:starch-binding outer membrane protein, SusD/RagB family
MSTLFMRRRRAGTRCGRMVVAAAGLTLAAAMGACGDLFSLEQENPGQLSTATLYVPANAPLLVNGAISDFECAYSRYVTASGLLMDELINSIAGSNNFDYERRTLPTNAPYGTGTCTSNQSPGVYTTLSTARATTDSALARLEGWTDAEVPNRALLMARAATYAGYSLVLLGEGMCSAAINVGPEMTPAELFAEAKLRFDKAITHATTANNDTVLNFARIGRARAQLDAGQAAAAAADAALVPATYTSGGARVISTSGDAANPRRQNIVFSHTAQNGYSSVDPTFRNLQLPNGQPDPRVAVTNTGRAGTAPGTVIWTPDKYPTLQSPIPIAKYAEAQLILAEARVAAGDLGGAATSINNARNTRAGMPQYDATGQTATQVRDQIIEERRREFFLEGHRLGDIRRYNLPLNPATGSQYVTGGGAYGDQRCFPLPDVERINNPNIQ